MNTAVTKDAPATGAFASVMFISIEKEMGDIKMLADETTSNWEKYKKQFNVDINNNTKFITTEFEHPHTRFAVIRFAKEGIPGNHRSACFTAMSDLIAEIRKGGEKAKEILKKLKGKLIVIEGKFAKDDTDGILFRRGRAQYLLFDFRNGYQAGLPLTPVPLSQPQVQELQKKEDGNFFFAVSPAAMATGKKKKEKSGQKVMAQ